MSEFVNEELPLQKPMKNTEDLKEFLLKQIQDLKDGKITCAEAVASSALAGRIIDCEKIKIINQSMRKKIQNVGIAGETYARLPMRGALIYEPRILDKVDLD